MIVVWLRRDLRLAENPALADAAARGAVVPVFVLDPRLLGRSERRDAAHRRPRVGSAAGARHLRPLSSS